MNPCITNAMNAAAPVFWGGVAVLFLLVLRRSGWNFHEVVLAIIGVRSLRNLTALEKTVSFATVGLTMLLVVQGVEACKT